MKNRVLFDSLATNYRQFFAVAHRAAYDDLAWGEVSRCRLNSASVVIDAGCGDGRWMQRFAKMGARVIGIDHSEEMIARARDYLDGSLCELILSDVADVDFPHQCADLVVATGSIQYFRDPQAVVGRFSDWLKPGGKLFLLYDSQVAIVLQLLREGRTATDVVAALAGRGVWRVADDEAEVHLLNASQVEKWLHQAGFHGIVSKGLLVSAAALGIEELKRRLSTQRDDTYRIERSLMSERILADIGKHILTSGVKKACCSDGNNPHASVLM